MRMKLKLRIVEAEIKHQSLAIKANRCLPAELSLSELDITKIVTSRKDPAPEQAAAIARVLGSRTTELFPDLQITINTQEEVR